MRSTLCHPVMENGPSGPLDTCREGTPSDLWLNWLFLAGSSASSWAQKHAHVSVSNKKQSATIGSLDQSLHSCTLRPNARGINRDGATKIMKHEMTSSRGWSRPTLHVKVVIPRSQETLDDRQRILALSSCEWLCCAG